MFLLRLLRIASRAGATLATELFPALARGGARSLPPMRTTILAVLAGIALPFLVDVDARPASMSTGLATQRLARFRATGAVLPALCPEGALIHDLPAFRWPAIEGAERYGFRLYRGDALWIGSDLVREARYRLRPPGRLEGGAGEGKHYRFEIRAYDAAGRSLRWGELDRLEGSFTMRELAEEDLVALQSLRRDLPAAEAAFVAAGLCAEKGSACDVAAALEAYLDVAPPGDASAAVAVKMLTGLGWR